MSDLGSDLKDDEVVELPPPKEIPENDGWGDDTPADDAQDDDGVNDVSTDELAETALDERTNDDAPELPEPESPSDQQGGRTTETEVRPERQEDGWGDDPVEVEAEQVPEQEVATDATAPIDFDVAGRAEAEGLPVDAPHDGFDAKSRHQTPDVGASRDAVEAAYEQQESRQPEFADVDYKKPPGDDALGFARDEHVSQVIEVEMPDGEPAYLKPSEGEDPDAAGRGDCTPAGTGWKREVAACEVDRLLGLGVVPETVAVNDASEGPASLQENAPIEGLEPISQYESEDIDRMAVLDYVIGSTDRHADNYLTQGDLRPAAIDNGYSFPTSADVPITSSFVSDRLDTPLSRDVIHTVRSVNPGDIRGALQEIGIESPAIDGCIERLQEIQKEGRITGEAWGGRFVNGHLKEVRR